MTYVRTLILLLVCVTKVVAQQDKFLDLEIIKQIESAGIATVVNDSDSGSAGLYQINPICLAEYNRQYGTHITKEQLLLEWYNEEIALWMTTKEIPRLLKYYKFPLTIENQIIVYNAGINYLVAKKKIPKSTLQYILKYQSLIKKGT